MGSVTGTSCVNSVCTWTISLVDVTKNTRSDLVVADSNNYTAAVGGAVEVYGLTSCSQYPAGGLFLSGIAIKDHNLSTFNPGSWAHLLVTNPSPSCGLSISSTASTTSLYHNYTGLSNYISLSNPTSTFTVHPSGGIVPYAHHWEWCAVDCFGSAIRQTPGHGGGGGPTPQTVEVGWHDIESTSQSICFDMSDSWLRVTTTDHLSTSTATLYEVGTLTHSCS